MNTALEPRTVEKPFIRRWLCLTFALLVRAPLRFGLAIAVLAALDAVAIRICAGVTSDRAMTGRVAIVFLPILWVAICALTRGADDPGRSGEALRGLLSRKLWIATLTGSFLLLWITLLVSWSMHDIPELLGLPPAPDPYVQQSEPFVAALLTNVMIVTIGLEPYYAPLLALGPGLSHGQACFLSKKAAAKNGRVAVWAFVCAAVFCAHVVSYIVPAQGLVVAAFIVFMGVFDYVAYRDIFERRSENVPLAAGILVVARVPPEGKV